MRSSSSGVPTVTALPSASLLALLRHSWSTSSAVHGAPSESAFRSNSRGEATCQNLGLVGLADRLGIVGVERQPRSIRARAAETSSASVSPRVSALLVGPVLFVLSEIEARRVGLKWDESQREGVAGWRIALRTELEQDEPVSAHTHEGRSGLMSHHAPRIGVDRELDARKKRLRSKLKSSLADIVGSVNALPRRSRAFGDSSIIVMRLSSSGEPLVGFGEHGGGDPLCAAWRLRRPRYRSPSRCGPRSTSSVRGPVERDIGLPERRRA